jgi:hypothetical protein
MHKWLGLFSILLLFSSCGEKKEEVIVPTIEKPADLIPEDKMIQVLADVHLLEAATSFRAPRGVTHSPFSITAEGQTPMPVPTEQKTLAYYDIFAKYGYTRDQYERSNKWYMQDAAHYSAIYDEVINELTRLQANQLHGTATPNADTTGK